MAATASRPRKSTESKSKTKAASMAEPKPGPNKKRSTRATAAAPARSKAIDAIRVHGAREHNLKNIDVEIPHGKLVVVTGLSGSGKSSLAFDTIFAEGQRKYMESLSAYARQFLDQLKKPDVDDIEGLPPTIAIEQRTAGHNPRSTVATSTEIYDYLRLLFARCGTPTCWHPTKQTRGGNVTARCGKEIASANPSQITAAVSTMAEGTRLMVLAPIIRDKKGFHKEVLEDLVSQGFVRARVNANIVDLREVLKAGGENPLNLGRYEKHTIEAIVDRIVVKPDARQRLSESVETALKAGSGNVIVSVEDGGAWSDTVYSEHYACALHPEASLEELEPRLFSFNSPHGACPACHGLGSILEFDEAKVVPDETKPLSRAIAAWKKNGPLGMFSGRYLRRFCRAMGVNASTPYNNLSDEVRRILIHGADEFDTEASGVKWDGVLPMLAGLFERTESQWTKDHLNQFMSAHECHECHGDRLSIKALSVFIPCGEKTPSEVVEMRKQHGLTTNANVINIADFTRLNIATALRISESMQLTEAQQVIAAPILREVKARLGFLASVGLEYLSLDRKTATLSGGEAQRIRLATQVGSGLVGAAYVLDEPTIGLHARDNARLIGTLRHLADIGNTVIIVEHDEEMIRCADHIVDIGPGPGVHGGKIVAQGTVAQVERDKKSLTGQYLAGTMRIETPAPKQRRALNEKQAITVKGARQNNLKNVDVAFPLGGMICVTGVSGSGKSTLVNDILLPAAKQGVSGVRATMGDHGRVTGLPKIDRVIEVDQSPIGRTPRSNPATYTGVFDDIRRVFAQTKEAKIRGYEAGRFSFNVKGGRCEVCAGQGVKRIEMHFLPDVYVECETCKGTRYNRETLDVTYRGKTIADVLAMTVEDACIFFENHPKILRFVKCLADVGLGYLQLGQPSTTLSGGEAQRVKLATELGKGTDARGLPGEAHTLYILDEPTTGLHFEDVRKLIEVLNRLADQGNTLVIIEHNLDVIKCADWIIDLGPEGGDAGGTVVVSGTPETVAKHRSSFTGAALRPLLNGVAPDKLRRKRA
ncbi:MAG: excinuclease ABC subunit UvrA [Phycisphaerales bacterium]|nr:excinuclease ABC subunit UvrA [Phycisphaerales bacterium]